MRISEKNSPQSKPSPRPNKHDKHGTQQVISFFIPTPGHIKQTKIKIQHHPDAPSTSCIQFLRRANNFLTISYRTFTSHFQKVAIVGEWHQKLSVMKVRT